MLRIPSLEGRTLNSRTVRVPDDFTGARNLLVVAFERSHLIVYPSWRAALMQPLRESRHAGCYALLLAGEKSGWRRRIYEIGLRMETTDWHVAEHTAIAYMDPVQWCAHAGIRRPDLPLVVVSDSHGTVRASTEGDPTPANLPRIAAAFRL